MLARLNFNSERSVLLTCIVASPPKFEKGAVESTRVSSVAVNEVTTGVGPAGLGVGDGVGLGVGDGVGLGVGDGVGLGVGDGVGLGVGDGVGLGVGDGVGLGAMPPNPTTSTGTLLLLPVPSPSWPLPLSPQQLTLPVWRRPQVNSLPPATWTAFDIPETLIATSESEVVPSPS
jgi:hypothetical protein